MFGVGKRGIEITRGKKEGNCLASAEGVIGNAIGGEGIQAGTENAKVMRSEDGVHGNDHNLLKVGRGWRRRR